MFNIYSFRDLGKVMLFVLVWVLAGWLGGWLHAHYTVASECKKLGGFYVGKEIFKCSAIEPRKD